MWSCAFLTSAGVSANESVNNINKAPLPPANTEAEFDTQLLRQEGQNQIDVSRFTWGASAIPGKYRIDILVNDNRILHDEVAFKEAEKYDL